MTDKNISLSNTESEENEQFCVDDASKAMWAINKVKELKEECDFYVSACKTEIERLRSEITKAEKQYKDKSNYFLYQLDGYMNMDGVPSKTTKTQVSLKLPNGKIVRKLPKLEIVDSLGNVGAKVKTNPDLINAVDAEFLINTPSIDWANLKKHLVIGEDGGVYTDDGEVIECLTTQTTLSTVDIKFIEEDE